jgi:hypothetical protein
MTPLDFSSYSLNYFEIEEIYTQREILEYFFPALKLNAANNSPFRKDTNPSFILGEHYGKIHYEDLATGESGNVYSLIMNSRGVDFNGCLKIITQEMWMKNPRHGFTAKRDYSKTIRSAQLAVKRRSWMDYDLEYWNQFGIKYETLLRYNVSPISHIMFSSFDIICDKLAYVYKELKDGIPKLKTYQPYATKHKWYSNLLADAWEGWEQLPESGEVLIWTKSRKDVMSIVDTCNIPAISLQTETATPKSKIVNELKSRFEKIYILYDNDYEKKENWGRLLGNKLSEMYNLPQIEIHEKHLSKDYSSLYKNHNFQATNILKNLIYG